MHPIALGDEPTYDHYAPIYDLIGQARFGERMARWTLDRLAERGFAARRTLDLACGTGAAALAFAEAGAQVVGVDRSAAMLAIARGRARDAGRNVNFLAGDIRALNPDGDPADGRVQLDAASFDLAACFYDSLNYLTDDGDLARVFGGVARALRPGGWLAFDLNMEAEYATWDERDVVTHDSRDCMVYNRLDYDATARRATGRIVWFVRELDRWWRGAETHAQRAWRDAEVCAALGASGLALAERFSAAGAPLEGEADAVPRVIYLAQRPAS